MRLTHVHQMSLPEGRLSSCAVSVTLHPHRTLPISFDQRRHVSQGDRPGSWMALSMRMPEGADAGDAALGRAWAATVRRHGTLRTAFTQDGAGALTLHDGVVGDAVWTTHDTAGADIRAALQRALDARCTSLAAPSHVLCRIAPHDGSAPVVVLASDHAHVDMWSLLVLARDLLQALDADAQAPSEVSTFAEHTRLLEQAPDAPEAVRRDWARIMTEGDGRMPVFPMPLGDLSTPRPEVVEVRDVLDADGYARLTAHAAASGVRVAALAMSLLADATRRLAGAPLRAVFPVHSRFEQRWHDAVGWFITNAVIDLDDEAPASGAAAIKRALASGSHPLAPLLAPWGGMPDTPGMFAVSWLDARRIPIEVPGAREVQWVSAATRTDGVMIWFLAAEEGLHLRVRSPDTAEARASVGRWVDAVTAALQGAAAPVDA